MMGDDESYGVSVSSSFFARSVAEIFSNKSYKCVMMVMAVVPVKPMLESRRSSVYIASKVSSSCCFKARKIYQ